MGPTEACRTDRIKTYNSVHCSNLRLSVINTDDLIRLSSPVVKHAGKYSATKPVLWDFSQFDNLQTAVF